MTDDYREWLLQVAEILGTARLVGYYEINYSWTKAFKRGLTPAKAVEEMWIVINTRHRS